jgi:hypothetical protein
MSPERFVKGESERTQSFTAFLSPTICTLIARTERKFESGELFGRKGAQAEPSSFHNLELLEFPT